MAIERFEQLDVWQDSHRLVLGVYKYTENLPRRERYGLSAQMRRCAVSVPANIAEGFKRLSDKEKARFYNIAQSSLEELKYYYMLCRDLGYGDDCRNVLPCIDQIGRMLGHLIRRFNRD